jgi:hypothetical protein
MDSLKDATEGKDTFSGAITAVHVLGPVEDEQNGELLHVRLTTDAGPFVYLKATKAGIEALLARGGQTATFVGEYLNEEKKHLGCDSVYFWGRESEESASKVKN